MNREARAWFCLRAQPRHEHIAAAHLQKMGEAEVYLPRLRYRRSTREGPAWVTEPLFPGYLFARFAFTSARRVEHTCGVTGIVHFGAYWPRIPDPVVEDLRARVGDDQVLVFTGIPEPGEEVLISGGALHDLHAVVERVMPGRQRVAVLLDFLGRRIHAELPVACLVKQPATLLELQLSDPAAR